MGSADLHAGPGAGPGVRLDRARSNLLRSAGGAHGPSLLRIAIEIRIRRQDPRPDCRGQPVGVGQGLAAQARHRLVRLYVVGRSKSWPWSRPLASAYDDLRALL